ncbi:MAG: hypothetical protein LBK01_04640, partial [Burkholderiaceae bacterium]|nr:hypothetical protein [Burkholderiaceae bacterium]
MKNSVKTMSYLHPLKNTYSAPGDDMNPPKRAGAGSGNARGCRGKRRTRDAAQGARHTVTETNLLGRRENEYRSNAVMRLHSSFPYRTLIACFVAALCSAMVIPALAENKTYDNSAHLQPPPAGTFSGDSFGPAGYTSVKNNIITIDYDSNTPPAFVFGGYSASGNVTGNEVRLIRGIVSYNVYGGDSFHSFDGNATNNTVTVSDKATVSYNVFGGYSDSGTATDNIVNISGGSVGGNVTGGSSNFGTVTVIIVNISGGIVSTSSVGSVSGGFSIGSGNATNNTVNISGGTVDYNVAGGNTNGSGHATDNIVNISGGIVGTSGISNVTGGNSMGGTVTNNTVNISGGSLYSGVIGGNSYTGNGDATDNIVNISGGSLYSGVIGGNSRYGNGDATGNIVNISGGIVSTSGAGSVTGGFSNTGNATGNTVNISGNANIVGVTALYGGDGGGTNKRAGNTLHINHWKGSTQAAIANFENYRFTLPASTIGSGQAVLTTSGGVDLGSNANVSTLFMGIPAAALQVGQQAILIAASSAINSSGALVNTSVPSTLGATDYTFDVALGNGDTALVATLAGKAVNQNKAGAYLYGASARLAALTSGADHVVSLLDNWQ